MIKSFVFPGQGSQTIGMMKEFYDNFSFVKNMFEEADDCLQRNITNIIFNGPEDLLMQTENAQPAIMLSSAVVLEILKKESGKKIEELCDFVAGHSLGEYSALYASEAIDFKSTIKLLNIRGIAFAEASKNNSGTMIALIGSTIEQAEEIVNKSKLDNEILQIANDNTVGQVIISGSTNSAMRSIEISKEFNIKKATQLKVSGAFHSQLMSPAVSIMSSELNNTAFNNPKVNIIANYTAKVENKDEIKNNLIKQITGKVRWRETMLNMEKLGSEMFVELGNGKVLSGMVNKTCPNIKAISINSIDSLKEFLNVINN